MGALLLGGLAAGAAPALAAPFALIGNSLDSTVSVIDVANPVTATAIPITGSPAGIATNPVRAEGYVAVLTEDLESALVVVDTNALAQVAVIPLSVIEPTDVAVNPAGTRAYVSGGFFDTLVSVVDLTTRQEIKTIAVGNDDPTGPIGLAVHPTQARLYVANYFKSTISVVNTSTNAVVATIALKPCPSQGCAPLELALNPTGAVLYVSDAGADAVWVINTATNAIVRAVPLGALALPEGLAVHPDDTRVYVTHLDTNGDGRLSVISTAGTNPIVDSAAVGANPLGVAVDPSGATVYVVNNGDDTVTVASTDDLDSQQLVAVGGAPTTLGAFITAGPTIRTLTPIAGPVGTVLSIIGTNFDGTTGVTFTGPVTVTATAVTATTVTVTVPPGALTGPVSLAADAGTGTSPEKFTVRPRIDSVTPSSAAAGSTTEVVVTGFNLRAATGEPVVKVGGVTVPADRIVLSTLTQLRFTLPLTAVTGKVTVTTADGTATSASALGVIQPPKITALAPTAARVGTLLTITGANLTGVTVVTFTGPVTATPTLVTPTSVQVIVPAGAQTGTVSATNAAGIAFSSMKLVMKPSIAAFSPPQAVAGSSTPIVVSGTNLRAASGNPVVRIGTTVVPAGLVLASTQTQLRFTIPLGAITNKISITTVDGTALSPASLVVIQPPKVTTFTPPAALPGATIVIGGANLTGATEVTFTGPVTVTATAVTATSLKAQVPVGALTGPVSVTNSIGTGVSTTAFKVLPKILNFTPSQAVAGSSTPIVVTGTNLGVTGGNPIVKIGTVAVPSALILSSTQTELQFTVPLGAVTGPISITTAGGTATGAVLKVIQPPKITTFTPPAALPDATIVIGGANLANATEVTFTGPVTVTPTAVTATSLKVKVPLGAQTGPVSVTNNIGTGISTLSFKVLPKILGFAPGQAVAGSDTSIVVIGTNLGVPGGNPIVKIGMVAVPNALILSSTDTELQFRVPLGAVTGPISIKTTGGTATGAVLKVIQPPKITMFTPPAAPVGAVIVIGGANLTGATGVTFTGPVTVTPTAVTAASVTVPVPAGALTGPVQVTNAIGTATSTVVFKVKPKITGFTPAAAPVGASVVVSGFNLRPGAALPTARIGMVNAVVTDATLTSATLTVPPGVGSGTISVTTPDGTATSATGFRVIKPPTITGFTPTSGPVGTTVTVTGTNLGDVTEVMFGGFSAGAPTIVSATTIRVVVPAGAATGPVGVTNAAAPALSANDFTVTP